MYIQNHHLLKKHKISTCFFPLGTNYHKIIIGCQKYVYYWLSIMILWKLVPMKKEQGHIWCFFSKCWFCMYMTNLTLRLYFWGHKNFINIFEKLIKNCYPKTTFIFLISCLNQGEKKRRFISNFDLVLKIPKKSF